MRKFPDNFVSGLSKKKAPALKSRRLRGREGKMKYFTLHSILQLLCQKIKNM